MTASAMLSSIDNHYELWMMLPMFIYVPCDMSATCTWLVRVLPTVMLQGTAEDDDGDEDA